MTVDYEQEYRAALALVERELSGCFLTDGPNKKLLDAMRYSLLAGGKRVRPVLTLKFCEALCGTPEPALDYACAVEMLHTYSLIHDDLPCMDDDELRRGKPTCHVQYSEWLALLAGDAMQSAAFERLACARRTAPEANAKACGVLAKAAGCAGMCAGQYLDMVEVESRLTDEARLTQIHTWKTAALLEAACLLGLTASAVKPTAEQWAAAECYARELGLAFQIRDDMLDVESTAEELGKPIGSDEENGKTTFVTLYGLDKCRELVAVHTRLAKESITGIFRNTEFLCALARSMAVRKN